MKTLNGKGSVMTSMVGSVYSFLSSPRNGLASVFLLGQPSLAKYLFKEPHNQKWKWSVNIIALGVAISFIRGEKKKRCFISFALSSIGHLIAHYAVPPSTSQKRSGAEVLSKDIALIESNLSKGSGTLIAVPPSASQKISGAEVLSKAIALIESNLSKGSGALIRDDKLGYCLLTVGHVVHPKAIAYIQKVEVCLDDLQCYESGTDIVLFILDDIVENLDGSIPSTLVNAQLQIGEKVYFGGYPFHETEARLHFGHISYIGINGKTGIDGVAVPGMSGGPIAVERNGQLYVVGIIASETFDPIEGFSRSLDKMYSNQSDIEARQKSIENMQLESKKTTLRNPQFAKIAKNQFYIASIEHLKKSDPNCFENMWNDLNKSGVISAEGAIDCAKIIPGLLGLRGEYQQYENAIIGRLKASTSRLTEIDSSEISLPFKTEKATDSMSTVTLSLVQSLSTGLITAHLLQDYNPADSTKKNQESTEFEIGKKNRLAKNKNALEKEARKLRSEAKQSETFVNAGIPPILYRYVSKDAVSAIKKDGILLSEGEFNEIPFLTQPLTSMAHSVGAVSTDKLVTVFTDKIVGLNKENVRKVTERKGVVTYRINTSIPKEAIKISEA